MQGVYIRFTSLFGVAFYTHCFKTLLKNRINNSKNRFLYFVLIIGSEQ